MLPRVLMLATKKPGGKRDFLLLCIGSVLLLNGCTPPGPRALLDGEKLSRAGRYGEAIEKLERATALLPKNALAWNHLGVAYHKAGLPDRAFEAYKRAIELDRNLASARFNVGCLYLEKGRPVEAADQFVSMLMLQPKSVEGHLMLGVAQLKARRLDLAEAAFRGALALEPRSPAAMNGLGVVLCQRRNLRDGSATLYAAVQLEPRYGPALLNLAILNHYYLNDRVHALQYYRSYLAIQPRPANYEAVDTVVRQLERELTMPKPSPGMTNVPVSTATNKPVAAVEQPVQQPARTGEVVMAKPPQPMSATPTNRVVEPPKNMVQSPTQATAAQPVVVTSAPVASVEHSEFKRYAYLKPAKPVAGDRAKAQPFFDKAFKSYQDNRLAEALSDYEAAVRLDPAFYEAWYNLGLAAFSFGDLPRALEAYEKALAIKPDSTNAIYNFAVALVQAGYPVDAAEQLERAVVLQPRSAQVRFLLANLYGQQLGRRELAREHYLKLLEIEPQHPQAQDIRRWLMQNR